jgi:hypothetical protein
MKNNTCNCEKCIENIQKRKENNQIPKPPNKLIQAISKIRENNNKQWMDILQLAFKYAPEESKKIFKKITENDRQINELSKELCK